MHPAHFGQMPQGNSRECVRTPLLRIEMTDQFEGDYVARIVTAGGAAGELRIRLNRTISSGDLT